MEKQIEGKTVRVVSGDLTLLDAESFVFYADPELKLGTGYGNMIALRGGPKIQEELNRIGKLAVGKAVATTAGKLKADWIIHVVGPAFSEEDLPNKLRHAVENALSAADEKGVKSVAFPPMGTGFYGVDPALSARIMTEVIGGFLKNGTGLEDITICVRDPWDTGPYEKALDALA